LIETRLLKCLRTWQIRPDSDPETMPMLDQEIRRLLEFYICDCLGYGPKDLCGWWSDGVIHLEITSPSSDQFKLIGVTWIDSHGITPFEIDIDLDPADDHCFARTVFRIGKRDGQGRPDLCSHDLALSRILEGRPTQDKDWAMAVELAKPAE